VQFPLLRMDFPTARGHAEIRARIEPTGTTIGPHDTWLAASCVAYGLAMATLMCASSHVSQD
jgi:predicted nucleic acid-binding protein